MGRFIAKIIRMHMCVENEVVRWKFILEDRMFQVRMEALLFERVAW